MFSIVLLKTEPKQLAIIPSSWFASLDIVQIFNYGISRTKRHRIYYAQNMDDDPDFRLQLSTIFDENATTNYLATVHSVWGTYDAAERHMGSRRHILPAIYNENLERFHWTPPAIATEPDNAEVKQEPIADLIWMNGLTIDLLDDSEDEHELDIVIDPLLDDADEHELDNVTRPIKMEPNVVFPDSPNEVIDLTDNDLTKFVIAFSVSEHEPNFDDELDGHMEWFDQFPGPIQMKNETQEEIEVRNELVNDELLGNLLFETEIDGSRLVNIDGAIIRVTKRMYDVLLHYNQNTLYKTSCFDAKFIAINFTSLLRPLERTQMAEGDPRMKFIRHLFKQRVHNDAVRIAWFEEYISVINNRIMQIANN